MYHSCVHVFCHCLTRTCNIRKVRKRLIRAKVVMAVVVVWIPVRGQSTLHSSVAVVQSVTLLVFWRFAQTASALSTHGATCHASIQYLCVVDAGPAPSAHRLPSILSNRPLLRPVEFAMSVLRYHPPPTSSPPFGLTNSLR